MSDYDGMLAADLEALAIERGIDAAKVKGSGAGGNVLKDDWIKALKKLDRKEAKAVVAGAGAPVFKDGSSEGAEVDPVEPVPTAETADEKALHRLRRAVYGGAVDQPEGELLTRAADLIDYLRKQR